jgi:hypothetical protein
MGEKPLEGSLPQEEGPIASGSSGPSIIIEGGQIGGKKLFILGRKEEGESQVAMVEETKVPANPEGNYKQASIQ